MDDSDRESTFVDEVNLFLNDILFECFFLNLDLLIKNDK